MFSLLAPASARSQESGNLTSRWVLNPNQVDKEIGFNPAWQVSLLHRGGMSAGATAGHSATVIKSVSDYLDEFINRIKAANK